MKLCELIAHLIQQVYVLNCHSSHFLAISSYFLVENLCLGDKFAQPFLIVYCSLGEFEFNCPAQSLG